MESALRPMAETTPGWETRGGWVGRRLAAVPLAAA